MLLLELRGALAAKQDEKMAVQEASSRANESENGFLHLVLFASKHIHTEFRLRTFVNN